MATKHQGVCFRIGGGKVRRKNVVTEQDGTPPECADEIRRVLAGEFEVLPGQVQLIDGPPPPEPVKPKASAIRGLRKAELLDLIERTEALRTAQPPIDRDGTNKELEDAIIKTLGLTD